MDSNFLLLPLAKWIYVMYNIISHLVFYRSIDRDKVAERKLFVVALSKQWGFEI